MTSLVEIYQNLNPEEQRAFQFEFDARKKSVGVYILLLLFLFWVGAHRFYIGSPGLGIAYIIMTVCSFGILSLFVGFFELFCVGGTIDSANKALALTIYNQILSQRTAEALINHP